MLACLVHKDCKDISMRPMELPPGRTRVEAREDARSTLQADRMEAKSKRPPDPFMEVEHQLKQARVVGMKAQAAQIALQSIQTKIQMLRENAEIYIQTHGQHGYNEMVAGLLSRMARMGEDDVREVGNTPISVGFSLPSEQLGDDDDDDGRKNN
jgi:hypothetical protein